MRDFSLLPLIKLPCPSLLKTKTTHFAMRHVIFLDLVFSPFNPIQGRLKFPIIGQGGGLSEPPPLYTLLYIAKSM